MTSSHIPVLLHEIIDSQAVRPDGTYVDCTTGGGSMSAEIYKRLSPAGRLVCIDVDPFAIENAQKRFAGCGNVSIVRDNFRNLKGILDGLGIAATDGVIADLGLSSDQIDMPEKGFSYRYEDAPLDMRQSGDGETAADIINTASEAELTRILFTYGEEKFARQIARRIVKQREDRPFRVTADLAEVVYASIPAKARRTGGNPLNRTFQAFRVATNGNEYDVLGEAVDAMFDSLAPGGRLSILTFNSIEDRIVKTRFREYATGCQCPPDFPVCVCGRKPRGELPFRSIAPSEAELEANPRSHSARLRAVIKL